MIKRPREEELFEVCPVKLLLCRKFFENLSEPSYAVNVKRLILKALDRAEREPRYISTFYTLIPEKTWNQRVTPKQLKAYAIKRGGLLADYTEQALEWAQRLFNGETLDDLCLKDDTAKWQRLISWEGYDRYALVGDPRMIDYAGKRRVSSAFIFPDIDSSNVPSSGIVPLIVYKR